MILVRSDSVIRTEGMNILIQTLGKVDAAIFVSLIIKEPFDYTKWQQNLFNGLSLSELNKKATDCSKDLK